MLERWKQSLEAWVKQPRPNASPLVRWPLALLAMLLKDWQDVPDESKRRWLIRLLIGIGATLAVTVIQVYYVRWLDHSGRLAFEQDWLAQLLAWNPFTIWQGIWLATLGHTYVLLLLTLFVSVLLIKDAKPLLAISFGGGFLGASFFTVVGWRIWNRTRPELILDGLLIPDLHSFPSGHTAQTLATVGMVAYIWSRYSDQWWERLLIWLVALAIVAAVMLGRLLLSAHWPTDIIAGFFIGGAWLISLIYASRAY